MGDYEQDVNDIAYQVALQLVYTESTETFVSAERMDALIEAAWLFAEKFVASRESR